MYIILYSKLSIVIIIAHVCIYLPQFNDTIITTYNYTVSLSPEYLVFGGDDQDTEAITNDTSYTFNIPSDIITEHSPTVRVNIPGFTPVQFTSTPICEYMYYHMCNITMLMCSSLRRGNK